MKQEYLIVKNDDKSKLSIKEFAESNQKNIFFLVCEETYDSEVIKSAISKGHKALMSILTTQNMHPPRLYAEQIVASVMNLYSSESDQSMELSFDDKDYFYARFEP